MRWTSILLLTLVLGCGDRQPIAPSSLPPAGPVVPSGLRMALSGTVFERISGRPVEGARVYVWPPAKRHEQTAPPISRHPGGSESRIASWLDLEKEDAS